MAGHISECGAQCTGGNFSNWRLVQDFDRMGYPVTKSRATARSPHQARRHRRPDHPRHRDRADAVRDRRSARLLVPDLDCDFTGAAYQQAGTDRVSSAPRAAADRHYKVSTPSPTATSSARSSCWAADEAVAKGRRSADAIIRKTQRMFRDRNMGDYRDVSIEIIGGEATYGPTGTEDSREVVVKIAAKHDQKEALFFARPRDRADVDRRRGRHDRQFRRRPGLASPVIRMFSCLVPKNLGAGHDRARRPGDRAGTGAKSGGFTAASCPWKRRPRHHPGPSSTERRRRDRAPGGAGLRPFGRQGRLEIADLGIFARRPEYSRSSIQRLRRRRWRNTCASTHEGKVTRWRLPGINGFNFLLRQALGGGGVAPLQGRSAG